MASNASRTPLPFSLNIHGIETETVELVWAAEEEPLVTQLQTCGQRPKYKDSKSGTEHPYCSKTCARSDKYSCKLAGCYEPGKTAFGGYCSSYHSRYAMQVEQALACSLCKSQPRAVDDLCLSCKHTQSSRKTTLQELDSNRSEFRTLAAKAKESWKGDGSIMVMRAYRVFIPTDVFESRSAYRKMLDVSGAASVVETFYGAQCICDLGVNDSRLCTWQSCGICSILKSSFEEFEFGINATTGRFGTGIYSSTNPAHADEFATTSSSLPYRVMIRCEVSMTSKNSELYTVMGVESIQDNQTVFVSNAVAIIPKYVIMYRR